MMRQDPAVLEARTQAIGQALLEAARREHAHLTTLNRWTRQVLTWCLADAQVKAQVLRFIDCLPSLRTPQAVARHLRDYFPTDQLRLPAVLWLGASVARPGLLTAPALSAVVRQLVEQVAKQFIAGATPDDAGALAKQLASRRIMASFDLLGEQVVSEEEADRYAQRYTALLERLNLACQALPSVEPHGQSPWGGILSEPTAGGRGVSRRVAPGRFQRPWAHVSVKPSSLSSRVDPLSFDDTVQRILARLMPIARRAADVGAAITLDMEQYELRDLTLEVAKRLLLEPGLGDRLQLGLVVQAYLRDAETMVEELLAWLRHHDRRVSVRLVRGAYWDSEVSQAAQRGWQAPVYAEKWQTDQTFEQLTRQLLSAGEWVHTEIASHNLRSIASAMAVGESLGLAKEAMEFQFLYGMGDAIQAAVSRMGYPVRIYTPLGELIPGMAYLVRRILENTANESFLRQDLFAHASAETLLAPPASTAERPPMLAQERGAADEPFANFTIRAERERMARALDDVRRDLGGEYPLLLGGRAVQTAQRSASINPAHPDQRIGEVACAGLSEVARAVGVAQEAQRRWGRTPVAERVACLQRAAGLLRRRRWWFAALEVLEVGKPWREADADVVEAIEFLEYYSARMLELAAGRALPQRPGEANRYVYRPRGVCAVIAPWNFPLAILTGMSSAALAAGNAVILKPAKQSPVIAAHYARLLHEAGIPPEVVQYLPGMGEVVGKALVEDPGVAVIMFTGSKTVGLSILETASRVAKGQRFVKHVVTEMGGKNALIIDEDADLDAALKGILTSAFSYQGQKCSALSRLIVHEAVYEPLLERLIGVLDRLIVCDPADPRCDLGPLIDAEAQQRLKAALATAQQTATVAYRYPDERLPREGFFVGPALCAEVDPASPLTQEELFGPLLCVFRVGSFTQALALANDSDYALTGGVYSRSPSHIERAIEELEAGNLYLNRPITGALVGRQPFGGYKLSGLGTKAGGPDYLLQLLLPQTICENTTRHGMPLE